jgi:hypothetical protein
MEVTAELRTEIPRIGHALPRRPVRKGTTNDDWL